MKLFEVKQHIYNEYLTIMRYFAQYIILLPTFVILIVKQCEGSIVEKSRFFDTRFHHLIMVVYLFAVLHHTWYLIGHIVTGRFKVSGNQCIQLVRFLYCKLQIQAFPLQFSRDLNLDIRGGR